jgi:hypothetical protein
VAPRGRCPEQALWMSFLLLMMFFRNGILI